jgi:nicotinamide phosphoribosyltransferase
MQTRTRKLSYEEKRELAEQLSIVRLLNDFPEGIVSYVSDTYDLWAVCSKILPRIKDKIMARNGKLVIRPDSGDPVDIICGNNTSKTLQKILSEVSFSTIPAPVNDKPETPEEKGVVELLWDAFGGTVNEKGYKVLDPHIGVIYGDSITLERAEQICSRLEAKGFASTNVVLGIGSYTYNYNTRDTLGIAVKSTYCEVNGESREIFKDPVTDDGTKKSARGLLVVAKDVDGEFVLADRCCKNLENFGFLTTVFEDGKLVREHSLKEIRERLQNGNV